MKVSSARADLGKDFNLKRKKKVRKEKGQSRPWFGGGDFRSHDCHILMPSSEVHLRYTQLSKHIETWHAGSRI